ncbi:MAG: alpha-amylase family glycosyl hydrolase [Clostridium sp.]|uniref:alpha-amylase family glycosyl hydrolase n=1 Tax=Clostridium sp. TaxID=1506 RepID=UPI003EE674B1
MSKIKILHLFGYNINDINLEEVKKQGFDGIQIGPVQPLKEEGQVPWFLLYQPIDFKVGNYYYGYDDLKELFNKGKELEVKIIVDVVLNHVAGKNTGEIKPHEKVNEFIRENEAFFKEKEVIQDWGNRGEIINKSIGLPSLKLGNHDLQNIIIEFLNELISLGADGFRIDAGKHIALPSEGSDFFTRVFENLNRDDLFNYIEVIFSDENILKEYSKYGRVLTENLNDKTDERVNFIESHDTFLEFGYTKEWSDKEILEKYKILIEEAKNVLFYARPFNDTWKSEEMRSINTLHNLNFV